MDKNKVFIISSSRNPNIPLLRIENCDNFITKFKGLMFKKLLLKDEGIMLSATRESVVDSSIHMFFMNFDIAVIWLDSNLHIVDRIVAKKWHPYYLPKKPAKYTLEIHPDRFNDFVVGETLILKYA